MPDKISRSNRYHGPGLPAEGIEDAGEAYSLGLIHARCSAITREFGTLTPLMIAEQYDELVRCVAKATDQFVQENGTLFALMEDVLDRALLTPLPPRE